jgi:hypothetical protein
MVYKWRWRQCVVPVHSKTLYLPSLKIASPCAAGKHFLNPCTVITKHNNFLYFIFYDRNIWQQATKTPQIYIKIYIYIFIYYQLQLGLCPVAVLHKQWTIRNSNTSPPLQHSAIHKHPTGNTNCKEILTPITSRWCLLSPTLWHLLFSGETVPWVIAS